MATLTSRPGWRVFLSSADSGCNPSTFAIGDLILVGEGLVLHENTVTMIETIDDVMWHRDGHCSELGRFAG